MGDMLFSFLLTTSIPRSCSGPLSRAICQTTSRPSRPRYVEFFLLLTDDESFGATCVRPPRHARPHLGNAPHSTAHAGAAISSQPSLGLPSVYILGCSQDDRVLPSSY